MKGWGRVPVWIGFGISLALGCGGRTSALEGDYGDSGSGSGAEGGTNGVAGMHPTPGGRPSKGGSSGRSGSPATGGTTSVSGSGPVPLGGYGGYGFGGTGPYPTAGYAGYGVSGSFPSAGFGGYYPTGGAGGYSGLDCQSCLKTACTPQVVQCFSDFGCLSIFGCMSSNNCQAFNCYTDATCKGTIDQFGGPAGPSMNELLQTFVCAFNAGCQCG